MTTSGPYSGSIQRPLVAAPKRLQLAAAAIDFATLASLTAVLAVVAGWLVRIAWSPFDSFFVPRTDFAVTALFLVALLAVLPTAALDVPRARRGATVGQRLLGLRIARHRDGRALAASQALARWILLYVPLALLIGYPLLTGTVYDPRPLLILIEIPWMPIVAALPLAWYLPLAISALLSARPLHDRIVGSVVVEAGAPVTIRRSSGRLGQVGEPEWVERRT